MDQQSNTYVIPLDGIDLNYMKTTLKMPNGKITPLWTRSNSDMGRNEYYEFKFSSVDKDGGDNSEDSDTEAEELHYTPCCICDIDVPSPFLDEHYDSAKHKINLKIANTALERVKKSINFNNKVTKSCKSLYFCPICVAVVEVEEKKSHNRSMSHKNAVKLEKIFEEFSNFYANDGEDGDSDDSRNEKSIKKTVKKKFNTKSTKNVNKNDRIFKKSYSVQENKSENIPPVKNKEIVQECNKIREPIDDIEKDLKRNFEKLMMNFDTLREDTDKISFFTDNLEFETNKDEYDNDRNTDNTDLATDKLKTTDDKTKLIKNDDLKEIDTDIIKEDLFKPHHHIEITNFYVHCKVCKQNIVSNEFDHIKDLQHEINYENFIEENSLYRTNSRHIECRICNVSFPCEDEISHCDEIRHITNCERFKKRNSC